MGIDPSLSATGFASIDADDRVIDSKVIQTKPGTHDLTRCIYISDTVVGLIRPHMDDHRVIVFIEPIPFAKRPTGKSATRYEIVGLIKRDLYNLRVPTYLIGNTTLKHEFAGHGHAGKDAIQAAVYNRFRMLIKNDNVADGIALAALGSDYVLRKKRFSIERLPMAR